MDREELNHQAYEDVFNSDAPTYPDNPVFMECYRFWYPLGAEAQSERDWEISNADLCMVY